MEIQDNKLDPKIWKTVVVVFLGPFMSQIDSTVVNISLEAIRADLNTTISAVQWILSGYLLALALMLPLNGWLVDRLGAKKLYIACFSLFTLASVFCGASTTISQLIWARVLQGIAGGFLAPMTQLMMARVAGRHMARVMGYAAIPIMIAPILGPVVAAAILKYSTWPWLFYINLPVGIIAVLLAIFLLDKDEPVKVKQPLDLLGFFIISTGLVCLLYGLEETSHQRGYLILICGFIFLGLFMAHAKKKKHKALIDLELFKNKIFLTAARTQFFANGIMYGAQFLIPLYLINGCGLTPSQAGWMIAPMGFGMMASYALLGILVDKYGYRAVATGGVILNCIGTLPFLWIIYYGYSPVLIIICLIIRGAGQGATGIPSSSAAYVSVPRRNLNVANTALNIVQRLGGPIATTVMAIIMSMAPSHETVGAHAFMIPFITLIIFQLLVIGSAMQLPSRIPVKLEEEPQMHMLDAE